MATLLTDIAPHRWVTISGIGGGRSFRRRLMEMSLLPGSAVRIVGVAPFGDPLILETRSGRLSIRRREAGVIEVEA